eukprot:11999479-Ditylum_brightwellii.AAC.1
MVAGNHPELDDTNMLDVTDNQRYQMFIRMLNWIKRTHSGIVKNGAEGHLEIDLSEKLKEHCPDTAEEIDNKVLKQLLDELTIMAYVDSDHAHNKMIRRSITGLITFVGRTLVMYQSKRQGVVETSTYRAKFMATKTAVEE